MKVEVLTFGFDVREDAL